MATAAGDRTTWRRAGRRQASLTPSDVGEFLRQARDGSGVTLTDVHDRSGVPLSQLEALEAGDLSRFPDLRSAVTAVRRCADLAGLDSGRFVQVVEEHWTGAPAKSGEGAPSGRRRWRRGRGVEAARADTSTVSSTSTHLDRYPGEGSHLRAFTQTAEVPGVTRGPVSTASVAEAQFSVTGVFPAAAVWQPVEDRPVPLVLRIGIWGTVALLLVALGGLAVDHWRPAWLKDAHIVLGPAKTSTSTTVATSSSPGTHPTGSSALVFQSSSGTDTASISVRAANFSVEVAASGACWVRASTPQSFAPVYQQTLQAGQSASLQSADGQLTVNLGSSYALLAVEINGKAAPGWLFKPPAAPFVLNFSSTTS